MVVSDGTDVQDRYGEDPIDEAAAGWVARLSSSDATESDRAAFEAWLAADPAHAEAYAEMDAVWRRLGHLPVSRTRRMPKGPACLAAAAVLGAVLATQFGLADWLRADLWSGVGAIEHAILADGSRIDLNTGTALVLHFSDTERRVELLRGEALFDVAPDPARPFVVDAAGVSARAVGTVFFVRADGAAKPVGVAEGRVDVTASGRHLRVAAGEAIRRQDGGAPTVVKDDVNRAVAWRDGHLIFSGERLSDVLAELERYRRGRIVLLDARLGDRRVTGSFDPRNTDDALDAIAATFALRVTRLTPLVVLIGPS
ncbi:FecR family protein [Methylobacterium oryzisoli]|uniref:FecR family protein n=1 Tax=Methylobacterium oryzisoli TaxID=3385502 RepID=UPI0038916083